MANELQTKLDAILLDKNTNLLPENLKKGVTLLGVEGNLESGGSTEVPVKLFGTQEEMQADVTAQEGDLAIVYGSKVQNATADSKFQTATFPDTVVLDTAITDYVEVRYRAVDSSVEFDCMGQLDSSRFMMDCYTSSGSVRVEYTSEDGITYTRTDTTGNPVDFGTEIYYAYPEMWNDVIGKFIQVGGNTFEGLFSYQTFTDTDNAFIPRFEDYSLAGDILCTLNNAYGPYNLAKVFELYDKMNTDGENITNWSLLLVNGQVAIGYTHAIVNTSELKYFVNLYAPDGKIVTNAHSGSYNNKYTISDVYLRYYLLDLDNMTYESAVDLAPEGNYSVSGSGTTRYYWSNDIIQAVGPAYTSEKKDNGISALSTTSNYAIATSNVSAYKDVSRYKYAPSQLSATSNYVYEKEFYGKNGVETGTLGTPDNSFADTNAEIVYKIQNQYENMEPRVLTDDDKTINKNIYFIPVNAQGKPLLDTSTVTDMSSMFERCTNLTTIPLLDTSKVTNMNSMFITCTNLTNIPTLDTSNVTNISNMFVDCTNLTTIPVLNTSKVTSMYSMFVRCTNLTTIPALNTSKVTNMQYMFSDCPTLSDESLNNILAMCTNATSYAKTKTLAYIGLTSEQANKCKTLSNYSAFTSAGWTTGY